MLLVRGQISQGSVHMGWIFKVLSGKKEIICCLIQRTGYDLKPWLTAALPRMLADVQTAKESLQVKFHGNKRGDKSVAEKSYDSRSLFPFLVSYCLPQKITFLFYK